MMKMFCGSEKVRTFAVASPQKTGCLQIKKEFFERLT